MTGALGAGGAAALSGCGFGAASSSATATSSASAPRSTGPVKGELTFSFWGGSDGETKGFTYAKDQFEKQYPGTKVAFNVVPSEGFFSGIDCGLQAGNGPDVFRVDYTTLGKYTSKGVLLELTPDLDSAESEAFLPALWEAVKYEGKVYGIPHQTDTSCVVYDKAALRASGITSVPSTLESAWTWEEFAGVATRLRAALPDTTFPFACNWTAAGAFRWLTWLNSAGGSLLEPDLSGPAIPSEAGTKALEFTRSFFTNRWVPDSNIIKGAKYSSEFFQSQTVAMSCIGDFSVPFLANPKTGYTGGEWAATFLPGPARRSASVHRPGPRRVPRPVCLPPSGQCGLDGRGHGLLRPVDRRTTEGALELVLQHGVDGAELRQRALAHQVVGDGRRLLGADLDDVRARHVLQVGFGQALAGRQLDRLLAEVLHHVLGAEERHERGRQLGVLALGVDDQGVAAEVGGRAVVLPTSASVFGIFLARQFFLAVPDELLEAAEVDGAGQIRTFLQIVLSLSRPLIAVLVLLTFMYEWNDFAWPLIVFFGNQDLFTLPLGLVTELKGQCNSNFGAIMAMSLLMVLPMVVLFLAFQRYFVQGMARTGLK